MAFIYKIYNNINNKIYIGKTTRTLGTRFYEHRRDSQNPQRGSKIHSAMKKYGCEHFFLEKIEECSVEELNKKEKYWISFYDSFNNGYNNTLGGDGISLPEEKINNIRRLWLEGKNCQEISKELNLPHSTVYHRICNYDDYSKEENYLRALKNIRKKVIQYNELGEKIKIFNSINEAMREVGASKGTNITEACKNHTKCKGYYWTFEGEEFKKHTNKKMVCQYDLNNNFVQSFDGARQAARQLGFKDATGIIKNCNKKQKTCNGFIFRYEREEV